MHKNCKDKSVYNCSSNILALNQNDKKEEGATNRGLLCCIKYEIKWINVLQWHKDVFFSLYH